MSEPIKQQERAAALAQHCRLCGLVGVTYYKTKGGFWKLCPPCGKVLKNAGLLIESDVIRPMAEALAAQPERWTCPNSDHACNLRGYCVNPQCDRFKSPVPPSTEPTLRRPKIICLCGSTRFIEQFAITTWEMERAGFIVFGCTLLPKSYCKVESHFGEATGTKEQCDELHKRKIDLADEILVLNIGGYIGESTRSEIEYATAKGKTVRYLEDQDYDLPCIKQR